MSLLLLFAGANTSGTAKKKVGWPLRHDPEEISRRQRRDRTFTRDRFDQIVELERAAQEAERKAGELKGEQERLAALSAAQEARRVAKEARARVHTEWAGEFSLLQLRHALDGFNTAHTLAARMQAARAIEMAAHAANMDDDEEAIALLLLH